MSAPLLSRKASIDFGSSTEYPFGIPWVAMSKTELKRRIHSHDDFTTIERLEAAAHERMGKNNHAGFDQGELQRILGVAGTTIYEAIARAMKRGTLAEGSHRNCLIVPGRSAQQGKGPAVVCHVTHPGDHGKVR